MLNVLSLYRGGTLQNLFEVTQDSKIDLLALQEVRGLGWSIIVLRVAFLSMWTCLTEVLLRSFQR